jgi:ketosteroid isomerase-like protein
MAIQTSAQGSLPNNTETNREIEAQIETYRLGFLHLDPEQLMSIWDSRHDPLIYTAQEMEESLYGWKAIQHYYTSLPEHLDEVSAKRVEALRIDVIGDTAIAFFVTHSSVRIKGRPTKYEPSARVSMIFHRISIGWLLIHFHESAQSAQSANVKSG